MYQGQGDRRVSKFCPAGFLRAKSANVSLLTYLAPWPWYIGELVVIGFLSLALYYAPFFVMDVLRRPKTSTS